MKKLMLLLAASLMLGGSAFADQSATEEKKIEQAEGSKVKRADAQKRLYAAIAAQTSCILCAPLFIKILPYICMRPLYLIINGALLVTAIDAYRNS